MVRSASVKILKLLVVEWIRKKNKKYSNAYMFWRGFIKYYPWVVSSFAWKNGNCQSVMLGIYPFIGGDDFYMLS